MSKKTAKQEKPLREKSQVIDDLDQLSQEIPRDDQALKDGSAKLKRLEKALKDKRAEVQRQGEETQQQVEALEEDYRHYSEQNKGLQAEKLEMQKQALAEMVSSAKESVDQAQSKVEKETQAYDEINQRVKSLKNDRFLLKEFKELEKRKAVVELLKGGTDESELDEEQQEIVEEIREGRLNLVGKRIPLKGEITELDLDLYILDKTSELDQQISGAGKNKKELERLFGNLQDKVEGQNPTPDKFLSNLVSYSTRQGEILKAIQAHGQEIESDDIEKVLDSYLKLDSVKNNGEAVGLAETLREQAQGKELTLDGFLPDLIDENEKRKETLKAIQAHGQEIDSDDIGEVLDSYLESDLVIDKEVVENLVESIKGLVKASYLTPEKLLSQDIQVAEQQKQEKSDELGALEQQVREKEQEFRQVQEAAKKWDAPYDVELEPDVQRRLDTRVRILQQKQDQARQELVAVEIDGLETNKQLALELHRLEKQVDEQRKLVKSQSDKVDQNNVKFHELTEERAQIEKDAIAKKKAVKKETGEPEQEFYLSDSPQYLRLQETIKHNKEINALKREHQLAMSSQSEELERLRAENLKLQQAQEQMQREKELREQSGVSVAEPTVEKAPKGISLFDDMMESSLEQQQSRVSGGGKSLLDELSDLPPEQLVGTVFEEEVRQARATRPEEILRLQARLAELELAQEEFTRTKENLKEIEHERDELRLEVAKEKSAKQEVEHDREEELDQLRETLEQRESALEVQTREKEKLAREISEERDAHRQELSKLEQSKNLELGTLRSQLEQAAKPSETLKAVKVENEKLKAEVRRLNLDVERYQSQGQRIKDLERQLAVLKSQVEQANIEKAAKQKELELAQAELRSTKEKGDDLASKLELAQESLADEVGPKKQALTQEVDRLKQQIEENRLEQERQRALLVSAKEEVERAALVEKEKLEKQLASLKSDVESRDTSLRGLEEQILQKQSALEEEQVSNKRALQQNAEELERVRQELVQATKGSEKAVELQQEVDRLSREKQELVQQGKEAALKNEKALEELRQSKDLEREELGKAKDRELAVLKSQVEQANIEKAAKQKELELAQAELRSTKEKGDDLASKLELAQESLADEVGPKKQALTQEVDRLKQQIEENRLEQERQRALLVSAKEEVERAALVEKEKLEKQLASLKSDVESRDASLRGLEEQILQKQSALEEEQVSNKRALQQNAEELERVRQELVQATKGSEKAVELQQEVDRLSREKQELVQQGKEAALKNEKALEELRQSKDLEREELGKAKDRELAVLKSQVEQANIEKAAKQKELELAQAELRSTKEKGDDLAIKLELAQESLLQGKGDKEKLDKEVARLKDEMRRNQEEQQRQRVELEKAKKELAALEKENERVQQHVERAQHELDQIARPMKKAAREERRGQEREHSQERGRTQERVIPTAVVKVSDRVAISDDQILQEFRALKDRQREVIVGSGKIQGIPQGNEAFHKYASENGALIGSKLDPETAKLMNDMEREKYKEIHAKYPYKDIDWQGGKKASISKDGVELCKLSDSVPVAKEYSLNGKVINNFRSLDVPLKADGGPMHMSLAVKDLQGKNISAKEAVYLSAHYDDQGKLVEMTTPVPVYFTSQDKESPVCIKQDGRVYTLPINRGRYEEMQKQIAINKGLVVDRTTELSHDQVEVSTRPVNKARQVIEGNPEALDKLKRHSSAHHSYPPVHRNQSKGNSRLME